MSIRKDSSLEISLLNIDKFRSATEIRSYLLACWAQEEPSTKYRYFVETLSDGNRIYLERPGRLNKGCDFVIYIENKLIYKNENDKPPKHEYIFSDLRLKKSALSKLEWDKLLAAFRVVHRCESIGDAIKLASVLPSVGENYDLLLKLTRWFFIEQDITYWSGERRDMFYDGILNI